MELIPPAEISGKIMTLIDQAQTELILISPYNKILYWKKLINRIKKAQDRGVSITWYIRKHTENNAEYIIKLGIVPIEIENLHCKLYLNEKHAVVTSMNLHEFSDSSSLDIGYYVTEQDKYAELRDFVRVYISQERAIAIEEITLIKDNITTINNSQDESFFTLLENKLQSLQLKNIEVKVNSYNSIITVNNFIYPGMELHFEPRGNYFRIDYRINQHYKVRDIIFNQLRDNSALLQSKINSSIQFGSEMKRLKFDLQILGDYNYKEWKKKEFLLLWVNAERIINLLKCELETEVYSNLINKQVQIKKQSLAR